ncbi:hypothetical protein MG293_000335 [Ovis ammon polii]|uniref:Uncharacterized protein n=1 Tax=Ovis ammon polii TaxID=230172 RepID=A0AAD4YEG8_OVIAM|nr:hypothetical protein MG293_000335 [Ovis ammon polii]
MDRRAWLATVHALAKNQSKEINCAFLKWGPEKAYSCLENPMDRAACLREHKPDLPQTQLETFDFCLKPEAAIDTTPRPLALGKFCEVSFSTDDFMARFVDREKQGEVQRRKLRLNEIKTCGLKGTRCHDVSSCSGGQDQFCTHFTSANPELGNHYVASNLLDTEDTKGQVSAFGSEVLFGDRQANRVTEQSREDQSGPLKTQRCDTVTVTQSGALLCSRWCLTPGPTTFHIHHGPASTIYLELSDVAGEGNGIPLQYSCLENPRDGGAQWAAVYGVTQSRTRLKRLSSSKQHGSPAWQQDLREGDME